MSTPAAPALSVIMSCYNAARYLRESMESILNQTFKDFEFLIIDDGSKDETLSILREYAQRDPRVRVTSRTNKGLTVSLNEALAQAKAPLGARMDADDVAMPERFEKQVAYMNAHPDVVLLGSRVELIDPYGVHIGFVEYPLDHETIDARLIRGEGGVIPHPACIYRLDAVRKVGNYQERFNNSEDLDIFLRLAEIGRVANLPDVLLKYRRDLGSVSHTKRDNQVRMKSTIVGEAYDRRGMTKPEKWNLVEWTPKPHDEQISQWGWRALKLGRVDAARGHARALLKLKPMSMDAWKLMYCAWRGR